MFKVLFLFFHSREPQKWYNRGRGMVRICTKVLLIIFKRVKIYGNEYFYKRYKIHILQIFIKKMKKVHLITQAIAY